MKARVKATGEIVSVKVYNQGFDYNGRQFINYEDTKTRKTYADNQLDFDNTDNSPDDYWERLRHQYTGMAMNALLLTNNIRNGDLEGMRECNTNAMAIAHALVEKLKKKEEIK